MPSYHLPKRREKDIQLAICHYLKAKAVPFWRHNNVGVFDQAKQTFRTSAYGLPGAPDLFVLLPDATWAIEVKSEDGRQSPAQKEFQTMWETGSHRRYAIVRSVGDLEQAMFWRQG